MQPIEAALASLEGQKSPNYAATAKKFGVGRSTLSRRHRGVTGLRQPIQECRSLLSSQQERDLVNYIDVLTSCGTPPTNSMVKLFAYNLLKKHLGKN